MKKFWELVRLNFKRNLTSSGIFSLLMPIVMVLMVVFISGGSESASRFAIVNLDQGTEAQELITAFAADSEDVIATEEEGMDMLREERIDSLFIFPADYSADLSAAKVPRVGVYVRDERSVPYPLFHLHLRETIEQRISAEVVSRAMPNAAPYKPSWELEIKYLKDLNSDLRMVAMMLSFSILYGSAVFGNDIVSQKKANILYRAKATPTPESTVFAANLIAAFLLQLLASLLSVLIVSFAFDFTSTELLSLGMVITLLCLYSAGFQALALRIFNDANVAAFVGIANTIVMAALSLIPDLVEITSSLPSWLSILSYVSPLYWAIEGVSGELLPAVAAMLLISSLMLLAGIVGKHDFGER